MFPLARFVPLISLFIIVTVSIVGYFSFFRENDMQITNILVKGTDFIERIGSTNATILIIVLFALFLGALYFSISLETHLSHSPLREFVSFGTYEVIAENQKTKHKQIFKVKAVNKIVALEKTNKKISNDAECIFIVNKIKRGEL